MGEDNSSTDPKISKNEIINTNIYTVSMGKQPAEFGVNTFSNSDGSLSLKKVGPLNLKIVTV